MKKLVYLGMFLLFCLTTFAQSPLKFGYQAVLRDVNGTILANENLTIEIDILISEFNGDVVFTELHNVVSDELGVIKLDIGSINSLEGIDWSNDNYFIRVYANGGLMGTSQLLSVPFAMHAQTAANVFSGDYQDLINAPDLSMYLTGIDQHSLGELNDVDITSLGDNKILKFNEAEGKWMAVDVASASESDPVYSASQAANITNAGSGIVISADERAKLLGIETGAQVNVNADWNAENGDAMIINKPAFADVATSGAYGDLSGTPALSPVATSGQYSDLVGTPALSTVATTGSYDDLLNKPAIFDGGWDNINNKPAFADVATSGAYGDLSGTPDLSIYLTGIDNHGLGELSDVDLTNIADNQILKYNSAEGKWVTIDVAAAAETDPLYSASQAANITNAGSGIVISADERAKLVGVETGAQVNVNADWNAENGDAMIINKPAFADVATSGAYGDLSGTPALSPVATSGQYSDLAGTPALSTVATTGSYGDLLNKPAIFDGEWNNINNKPAFADVATSGQYSDLAGTPALSTVATTGNYNDLLNTPAIFDGEWDNINNKPAFADVATSGQYSDLAGTPALSTVATTGNYNDLLNTPAIFDGEWDNINNKPAFADVATSGAYDDLSGTPVLSTVATSGQYSDLAGTPALSTVATTGNYNDLLNTPAIFDGEWDNINNKPAFADVATSGAYDDLSGTPVLSTVATSGQYSDLAGTPALSTVATTGSYGDLLNKPAIFDGEWNNINNKPAFADVATSGAYDDLSGTPVLSTVATSGQYSDLAGTPALSTVATTGSYEDLLNKPAGFDGAWESISGKPAFATVATSGDFEDLVNIPTFSSMAFSNNYDDLENKPILFNGTWASLSGKPAFSAVATSGSYNDLSNTPALHSVASSGNYNELVNKPALFDGTWVSLSGKPSLSTVATSGSYNDLSNTPLLHSVATSGNYNELVNRPTLATVASTGSYNDLSNKPVIFSGNFNDLTNKPTTLAGYGITNAMSTTHAANSISATNINNWNIAYSWGNHAGLYRSSTWTPTWAQVSGKPSFATVATSGNYNDLSNRPNLNLYATKDMGNQNITNLANPVNNQDAATKAYVDLLEERIAQIEAALMGAGLLTVKDGDGNEYSVVEIGGQYWLGENLKTTKLNDGTPIQNITNITTWTFATTPAYAWYNNSFGNKETYGALYNFYVVETGKICPAGWRVPSGADWDALVTFLGGVHLTGGKIKETGFAHWITPNTGASDETGFTARPGGMRFTGTGSDTSMGYGAFFWSTEPDPLWGHDHYTRELSNSNSRLDRYLAAKATGASIRCIKE